MESRTPPRIDSSPTVGPPQGEPRGQPCAPAAGRALSRLEPWLLLLLAEGPTHGYDLIDRLHALPQAPDADRGHLYRTLRRLDEQGLVTSEWQTPEAGPARHVYTLTPTGLQALDAWCGHIRGALVRLESFLERRAELRHAAPDAGAEKTEVSS